MGNIPYSRQDIDEDDIRAVTDVLRGQWLTQGPHIETFERDIADFCGAKHAVAFSNGTAALHASCLALEVGDGTEGIVPPISFVASANCLRYVGAMPRFTDVTAGVPLLDPSLLKKSLSPRTSVVIPVHFSGAACDMPAIWSFAEKNDLAVIEDACHALGATYRDEKGEWVKVGSCRHSDVTVFSFHPVKNITTGEGGMVTTNDSNLAQALRQIRQHGVRHPKPEENRPPWYYEMVELGFNYRITDIQAALGSSQLKKLDRFAEARRRLVARYHEGLDASSNATLLTPPETTRSANHLATVMLAPHLDRDLIMANLRKQGITAHLHYMPIYRQPYYREILNINDADYPQSEAYFASAMTLPLYPALTDADQDRVIQALLEEIR